MMKVFSGRIGPVVLSCSVALLAFFGFFLLAVRNQGERHQSEQPSVLVGDDALVRHVVHERSSSPFGADPIATAPFESVASRATEKEAKEAKEASTQRAPSEVAGLRRRIKHDLVAELGLDRSAVDELSVESTDLDGFFEMALVELKRVGAASFERFNMGTYMVDEKLERGEYVEGKGALEQAKRSASQDDLVLLSVGKKGRAVVVIRRGESEALDRVSDKWLKLRAESRQRLLRELRERVKR